MILYVDGINMVSNDVLDYIIIPTLEMAAISYVASFPSANQLWYHSNMQFIYNI